MSECDSHMTDQLRSRFWMAVELVTDSDVVSTSGVSLEDFISWSGGLNIDSIRDRGNLLEGTPFKSGDLLFGKLRPYLAKSWIANDCGVAVGDIHVYRARAGYDIGFLGYLVRTPEFIQFAKSCSRGVKMPRVEWTALSQYQFAFPDLTTQRRIAEYLDTEVGEMDAMVARLESLIADLEARRAKVIGYTLSEHVKSTSGEWPHHAFKFLLTTHFAGDWGEDVGKGDLDLPCVRVADFERTTSSLAEEIPTVRSYAEKTVERKHLEYNDLLVEKSGGGEKTPVGSVVLYQGAITHFARTLSRSCD